MNVPMGMDHVAWDDTQAVVLELTGRRAPRRVAVPVAKRRNVRAAQRSPSGGVYLGAEVSWHVPRAALPEGVEPRPADVVVEEGAARWTILAVAVVRHGEGYALGCVDLAVAHHLADQVVLERPSYRAADSGAAQKIWDGPSVMVKARVQELAREVAEERGARYGRPRYDVTIDRQLAVDVAEDRLRWVDAAGATRLLDVLRVRNAERIDELPVLECELR